MKENTLQKVLLEYREGLTAILGNQLESVLLYGSQARGDAHASSDIDVLCVMLEPFDYSELISRSSELTASLSLKYDVVLSRTFVTLTDFETRQSPFLMNIRREGAAV